MRKTGKVWICALLSVLICALGIGYAQVTGELSIKGNATYKYVYPVEIVENGIQVVKRGNTSVDTFRVLSQDGTFMNASVTLNQGSYILLAVTVRNNTTRDYAYKNVTTEETYNVSVGVYQKDDCKETLSNDVNGTVRAGGTLTFYVRLTNNSSGRKAEFEPRHTYHFTTEISDEEREEARKAVGEKFLEILNNPTDYGTLTTAIENNFDGNRDWTATFIGNVTGSTAEDTQILENLFDGKLSLQINGATVDVTCIVKRENIDGDKTTGDDYTVTTKDGKTTSGVGCEMTLYLTTHNLNTATVLVPVYAMVFTRYEGNTNWTQIGESMYQGQAQVVGYAGGYTSGSFDTGTWVSTATYHGEKEGQGIKALIAAWEKSQK